MSIQSELFDRALIVINSMRKQRMLHTTWLAALIVITSSGFSLSGCGAPSSTDNQDEDDFEPGLALSTENDTFGTLTNSEGETFNLLVDDSGNLKTIESKGNSGGTIGLPVDGSPTFSLEPDSGGSLQVTRAEDGTLSLKMEDPQLALITGSESFSFTLTDEDNPLYDLFTDEDESSSQSQQGPLTCLEALVVIENLCLATEGISAEEIAGYFTDDEDEAEQLTQIISAILERYLQLLIDFCESWEVTLENDPYPCGQPECGDGVCNDSEEGSCAEDCGEDDPCGDGVCDASEWLSCVADCPEYACAEPPPNHHTDCTNENICEATNAFCCSEDGWCDNDCPESDSDCDHCGADGVCIPDCAPWFPDDPDC